MVKLGFLKYVESHRWWSAVAALNVNKQGARTKAWSKSWSCYADPLGVKDARKAFHSFRHSFKNSCRAAHVTEEVHDRLTGHAGSGVGRSYGNYPLEPLAKAVKRLRFDDFPL